MTHQLVPWGHCQLSRYGRNGPTREVLRSGTTIANLERRIATLAAHPGETVVTATGF